jgi:hypothetical protein
LVLKIVALILGAILLLWWLASRNHEISVPDNVPAEATISIEFDRIEGDVDPAVLSTWVQDASANVRLGYQSRILLWPFTADIKFEWGYMPIPNVGLRPTTFWLTPEPEQVEVQGMRMTLRVKEILGKFLYLKHVKMDAQLPSPGLGLPARGFQMEAEVRPWGIADERKLANKSEYRFTARHDTFLIHGVMLAHGTYARAVWVREPVLAGSYGEPYRSPIKPHLHAWTLLSMTGPYFFQPGDDDPDKLGRAFSDMVLYEETMAPQELTPSQEYQQVPYPKEEVDRIKTAFAAASKLISTKDELRPFMSQMYSRGLSVGDFSVSTPDGKLTTAKRHGDWLQTTTLQATRRSADVVPPASGRNECLDSLRGDYMYVNRRLVGFSGQFEDCAEPSLLQNVLILFNEAGQLASYTAWCGSCDRHESPPPPSHHPDAWVVERVQSIGGQAGAHLLNAVPYAGELARASD